MILVSFSRIKAFDEWNFCALSLWEKKFFEITKNCRQAEVVVILTLSLLAPEIYIYLLTYLQAAVL